MSQPTARPRSAPLPPPASSTAPLALKERSWICPSSKASTPTGFAPGVRTRLTWRWAAMATSGAPGLVAMAVTGPMVSLHQNGWSERPSGIGAGPAEGGGTNAASTTPTAPLPSSVASTRAPASIHARRTASSSSGRSSSGGMWGSSPPPVSFQSSELPWSPGTTAGPEEPPARIAFTLRRSRPFFARLPLWHEKHHSRRIGFTSSA